MLTGFESTPSVLRGRTQTRFKNSRDEATQFQYVVVSKQTSVKAAVTKYFQVADYAGTVNFAVHNPSINNLERGVLERVFFVKDHNGVFQEPPRPNQQHVDQTLFYFKQRLCNHISRPTKMTRKEFSDSYLGRRKMVYEAAVRSLADEPISRADSEIRCFGKKEKTNLDAKSDPPMRIVSPRHPRYNVEVGVYLKPLEFQVYHAIEQIFGEPTVFKGLNARKAGELMARKWNNYVHPVAISTDASRFDQHVSFEMLKWEHSVYERIYNRDPDLVRLLTLQRVNKCTGYTRDGKLKYTVTGTRMSGDMNTALGNCLIMCAIIYSYCKHKGIQKYSLANNGDDCVIIFEREETIKFKSGFAQFCLELGFNMKVETPVTELEHIEFCQTRPIFVKDGYVLVRDPRVVLSKDCISLKNMNNHHEYSRLIDAIGQCGLSMSGGVPIMQEFYSGMIRAKTSNRKALHETDGFYEAGMYQLSKGMKMKYSSVMDRTRFSFWLAFGITPDMQIEVEKFYKSRTPAFQGVRRSDYLSKPVVWV